MPRVPSLNRRATITMRTAPAPEIKNITFKAIDFLNFSISALKTFIILTAPYHRYKIIFQTITFYGKSLHCQSVLI